MYNLDDWRFAGFCPICGKSSLYQHKRWDDGCSGGVPYTRCFECHRGYYLEILPQDADYYGDIIKDAETG